MALIELDLAARPDLQLAPPPAHRYRLTGLLVALLFAGALGGAVSATPRLWQALGDVPLAGADAQYLLAGDEVVTLATRGDERVATGWRIGVRPTDLWTTALPVRPVHPGEVPATRVEIRRVGDLVLLADGPATTGLDARTGRVRWSSPVYVEPLPGHRIGLSRTQSFRPGTLYDQDSGAAGPLYFTSTGEPHTEPPLRTEISGIELSTGRSAWSTAVPGAVNVFPAPGEAPALLIVSSDRLERRAGDTGVVESSVALSPIGKDRPYGSMLMDDTLLVYFGDAGGTEAGYSAQTLRRLWSRDLPASLLVASNCGDVLCGGGPTGLDVLDPATGRALWRAPAGVDLSRRGGYLIEADSRTGSPRRLVDPATGATRVDLTGWFIDTEENGDAPIVLNRSQPGGMLLFGVVLARHDAVQPLGQIRTLTRDCVADRSHVACRGNEVLRMWAYRS